MEPPECAWCGVVDRRVKVHSSAVGGAIHEDCLAAAHRVMCEHYRTPSFGGVVRCWQCRQKRKRKGSVK